MKEKMQHMSGKELLKIHKKRRVLDWRYIKKESTFYITRYKKKNGVGMTQTHNILVSQEDRLTAALWLLLHQYIFNCSINLKHWAWFTSTFEMERSW